jgi:hypothetical protein
MSSEISPLFKVALKKPVSIDGLTDDAVRELVASLLISVEEKTFPGFVRSTNGTEVKFVFGPDGNFSGISAKIGGKNVNLIPGAGSSNLETFKGPPNATNPGAGWKVEYDLTRKYFNQPEDESDWEIFYASRIGVLNTL